MEACRKREAEKLDLTNKLSAKNAELQSENSILHNKVCWHRNLWNFRNDGPLLPSNGRIDITWSKYCISLRMTRSSNFTKLKYAESMNIYWQSTFYESVVYLLFYYLNIDIKLCWWFNRDVDLKCWIICYDFRIAIFCCFRIFCLHSIFVLLLFT